MREFFHPESEETTVELATPRSGQSFEAAHGKRDCNVVVVKKERVLASEAPENGSVIVSRDTRMIASFSGHLPSDDCDENVNTTATPVEPRPVFRRPRRQILASIGQPPRVGRLRGWSRRGFESRSLDRSDDYRHNNADLETGDESTGTVRKNKLVVDKDAADSGSSNSKFRDDYSRREFIEKLRHFEQLTVQQQGKNDTTNSEAKACQSVPLARRPPPPIPSAPPKPPYQPHPEIENRLRFFDAAFGRHSNLRERQLENLVTAANTNDTMSASMSTAVLPHNAQRLMPLATADDSAIAYSNPKATPNIMSYSMSSATAKGGPAGGRIDVLNRISNQLLLSSAIGAQQPAQQPEEKPPQPSSGNKSLQATEAELRKELEHLDSMLHNIKETGTSETPEGANPDAPPLTQIARDRRHSVATSAMSTPNGGGSRIPRIQAVTIVPQLSKSNNSPATGVSRIPAELRAEIRNYQRPNRSTEKPPASTDADSSKPSDSLPETTKSETTDESTTPVKIALPNGVTSDRASPMNRRPDLSHSPSPSPPAVNGTKPRRVVFVRAKIPPTQASPNQLLGDSHKPTPKKETTETPDMSKPQVADSKIQTNVAAETSMMSPSSSASSTQGDLPEGSVKENDMPPPPTPSPPSRENASSDSSTPPPRLIDKKTETELVSDGTNQAVKVETSVTSTSADGTSIAVNRALAITSTSDAVTAAFEMSQPSPSLTPSTSNSDSSNALAGTVPAPGAPRPGSVSGSTQHIVSSPLISIHKQHQQTLKDISTLRHCLIDIETQQQNILQEVGALRAEASAVNEVESIRENIRATELRFELEKERANARLVAARNKVHVAARDLQHLQQQKLLTTPTANVEELHDEEGDESALNDAQEKLATLREDVEDADFELVEAGTRYEAERERLLARLSAASEATAGSLLMAKNAALIGGTSSYDYWIRRLTEHYRQLDAKRDLIERNLSKLQAVFNNQLSMQNAIAMGQPSSDAGSSTKDGTSADFSFSLGGGSLTNDKDMSFADTEPEKRSSKENGPTSTSTDTSSDGVQAESNSNDSRPMSVGDDQQTNGQTDVSIATVRLRTHNNPASRMIAPNDRPRTLFLPQPDVALDLREHLDALSHDWRSCSHVTLSGDGAACRGWLHKLTGRVPVIVRPWSRRWFVFTRQQRQLNYYSDSNENHSRGEIPFSTILDVYVESATSTSSSGHRTHRPPNSCSNLLIIVQTVDRRLTLAAPSPQAARIWVDVLCTGAAGNQSYEETAPQDDSAPNNLSYNSYTLPPRT